MSSSTPDTLLDRNSDRPVNRTT